MKPTKQALVAILVIASSILPILITVWIVEEQVLAGAPWWSTGSTVAVGVLTFLVLLSGGILALMFEKRNQKSNGDL